jgi:hypothetical protein
MERKILFIPAFDKTDPDPKKDYGVGCLELRFLLIGEKGVVEFQLLTQWFQEHVMVRRLESLKKDIWMGKQDFLLRHFLDPFPADVNYWSLNRISEDDTIFAEGVSYVFDGKPCYYGYKYVDSDDTRSVDNALRKLVEEGDEALWKYLEEYYLEVFG